MWASPNKAVEKKNLKSIQSKRKDKISKQIFALAEQLSMFGFNASAKQMSLSPLLFLLSKSAVSFMCHYREEQDTRPSWSKTSTEPVRWYQIPSGLPCHYSKLFYADDMGVFMCLTDTEEKWERLYDLRKVASVCESDCVVVVCVPL